MHTGMRLCACDWYLLVPLKEVMRYDRVKPQSPALQHERAVQQFHPIRVPRFIVYEFKVPFRAVQKL